MKQLTLFSPCIKFLLLLSLISMHSCGDKEEVKLNVVKLDVVLSIPNTVFDGEGNLHLFSKIAGDLDLIQEHLVEVGFCTVCDAPIHDRNPVSSMPQNGNFSIPVDELTFSLEDEIIRTYAIFEDNVIVDNSIQTITGPDIVQTRGYILDPIPDRFVRLEEVSTLPASSRSNASSFVADGKAYVGGGINAEGELLNDFGSIILTLMSGKE